MSIAYCLNLNQTHFLSEQHAIYNYNQYKTTNFSHSCIRPSFLYTAIVNRKLIYVATCNGMALQTVHTASGQTP